MYQTSHNGQALEQEKWSFVLNKSVAQLYSRVCPNISEWAYPYYTVHTQKEVKKKNCMHLMRWSTCDFIVFNLIYFTKKNISLYFRWSFCSFALWSSASNFSCNPRILLEFKEKCTNRQTVTVFRDGRRA